MRAFRRLALLCGLLALGAILGLATVGVYFLTQRFEYPLRGVLFRAVEELPADAGDEAERTRHIDYLYGERLGDLRSLRPGNSLGSARRVGERLTRSLDLADGQGRAVARARESALAGTDDSAITLEVQGGGGELVARLRLVAAQDASGDTRLDVHALTAASAPLVRRVIERRGLSGLMGKEPLAGTEFWALDAGEERLVFASREDGVADFTPQSSAFRYLHEPQGLFSRMFGREAEGPGFELKVSASWNPLPWTVSAGGYRIEDPAGSVAEVRVEDFLLRYRGQSIYHYLLDLDGDGALSEAHERIQSVLVSRLEPSAERPGLVEITFAAGTARLNDLEALRLGDALESVLVDACFKGFGRDSDLGAIEQARDDVLALLEPSPERAAATLSVVDTLRTARGFSDLLRAARRADAEPLGALLGARLSEIRFAGPVGPEAEASEVAAGETAAPSVPVPPPAAPESLVESAPLGPPTPYAPLPEVEARLLLHAERLLRELGDAAWPGFGAELPPILLVGRDFEWLLRHPAPPLGFVSLGPPPGMSSDVLARPRSFDASFQASFPLASVPCIVLGTPEGTGLEPARWALTYVHEAFHVFQMRQGEFEKVARLARLAHGDATGMWQLNYPFPYEDPAAGQALGLLGVTLDGALGALEPSGQIGRLGEWLRGTLGAQQALGVLLGEDDIAYLRFVEWKEGVARHVELRVAELAARSGLMPPGAAARPHTESAQAIEAGIRERLKELGPGRVRRESFYATGAALARLLDARAPGWQQRYFEPAITLEQLLLEAPEPTPLPRPAAPPPPEPTPAASATPAPLEQP